MKKTLFLFFTITVMTLNLLSALIIEADHFEDILKYVHKDTLVLLDIDDTLLIPSQMLGSDAWFRYRMDFYRERGESPSDALEKALAEWQGVRHLTKVEIVEAGSESIVKKMQEAGIPVMGLTTQGLALCTRTIQQLEYLNIDLKKSCPFREDFYFVNQHGVLYRNGILFTSGTDKGVALTTLLDHMGFTPEQVVFINDKATHLREVERTLEKRNIPFLGLRYSFSDDRVNSFDKEIAEIQWHSSSLSRILSDDEAKELLKN